jgi:2-methylcitrate dehydratase PrpD
MADAAAGHADKTIAEVLAHRFGKERFSSPPEAALEQMALYALDTLVCILGGTTAASSRAATRALLQPGGGPSTVIGVGAKASAPDAALINGAASHALELDDDHRVSVMHPGAVVIPAAFALAEATGASGRDFLRAVLAGYEVAIRAGEVFQGRLYSNGFHPTAVCGVFGSAMASAVLLGLDEPGMVRALGVAGTQASGLMEWRKDGSWIKRLHPGRAAQSGVIAALLAREAFTAPATVFEGEFGAFAALGHRQKLDVEAMTRRLGEEFRAVGTAIKPFPCCRFSHGAIDLALEAFGSQLPAKPETITVRLFKTDVLTYHKRPINTVDAQFNIPYLVATAMLTGRVGLSDFTEEAVARPDVLALAAKIDVVEDETFSALYPETYVTVIEAALADGSRRDWRSDCPSGDPEAAIYQRDPSAFRREALAKARAVLAETGFRDRAEPLIAATGSLLHASSVRAIGDILIAPPQGRA